MEKKNSQIINKQMLCKVGENYIYYYKGFIYYQNEKENEIQKLIRLPISIAKRILCKIRICERALRISPRLAVPLDLDNFLLSYLGAVYKISIKNKTCIMEKKYRETMSNVLSFCKIGDEIFYGDYFNNQKREPVNIYKRNKLGEWTVINFFMKGEIKHIHQIVYDKYRECIWILTGDEDNESGIWKTDLDFKNIEPVFVGKQQYRSVFLVAKEEGLYYVTDTPLERNGLYFVEISNEIKEPVKLYDVAGPSIFGEKVNEDEFVFSTSVEPNPSLNMIRYMFSMRIAPGIMDKYSHIYCYNSKTNKLSEIDKYKKDMWPMGLFQFGNVMFVHNNENEIYIVGQSIIKLDAKTKKISKGII